MEQYIKYKIIIFIHILFILPNTANSQQFEYSNYNTIDNNCNHRNIDFKIENLLYKNGKLQISMSFHNLEEFSLSLIKPDTSMIECSVLYILAYDNNEKHPSQLGLENYNSISQLACLDVKSANEVIVIKPYETVLFTMTIPLNLDGYDNPKIGLLLDYNYCIISRIELNNPIQQELKSNILPIKRLICD